MPPRKDGTVGESYSGTVTIGMIGDRELEVLTQVADQYGGSVKTYTSSQGQIIHKWAVHASSSISVVVSVLPYLLLKRDQAEIYLQFVRLARGPCRAIVGRNVYERLREIKQQTKGRLNAS